MGQACELGSAAPLLSGPAAALGETCRIYRHFPDSFVLEEVSPCWTVADVAKKMEELESSSEGQRLVSFFMHTRPGVALIFYYPSCIV